MIEEREEVVVLEIDLETCDESKLGVDKVRLGSNMPSPSILTSKRPRRLTQTLEEAQGQAVVPRSSVRVSIPPRRYASHVALVSSIYMPFNCIEKERCDTLMEDDAEIDSRFVANGGIIEYKERVNGFSQ